MAQSSVADLVLAEPAGDGARADLAACRAILRRGSKSFALASLMLPARVRDPAAALYAFCREADDLVDATDGATGLVVVHRRLAAIARGAPEDSPVDRAVARVTATHRIPSALLEALVEGFAWDAEGRNYETIEDVLAYAARVAASVGVMMTLLMGSRDAATLARAADLGLAMQLTNIARDVAEDAGRGRSYLPRKWLEDEGIDLARFLIEPGYDARIVRVIERLLVVADGLYESSADGVDRLPPDCRAAIRAASRIYDAIGTEIRRQEGAAIGRRAVVPLWRKIGLALRAFIARSRPIAPPRPAHPSVRFLLDRAVSS